MNESHVFECPHCQSVLRMRAGVQMESGPCPSCGGLVVAPPVVRNLLVPRASRTVLPPPRKRGTAPLHRADDVVVSLSRRPQLAAEVAAMPDGNNFGKEEAGSAARHRKRSRRKSLTGKLAAVALAVAFVSGVGYAALKHHRGKEAPEFPAAMSMPMDDEPDAANKSETPVDDTGLASPVHQPLPDNAGTELVMAGEQ